MTYTIYDASANMGSPYELFKFVCSTGNFYYTSNNEPVSFDGNTYEPVQITRGLAEISAVTDSPTTIDFSVPTNTELYRRHGRALTPPDMTVEVFRFHRGTTGYRKQVAGKVVNHNSTGTTYRLSTKNVTQNELSRKVASVFYNNQCNHIVYDARCKADKGANTRFGVVMAVLPDRVILDTAPFPDDELHGGILTIGGEQRIMLTNTGTAMMISYPFIMANVGQSASVLRWCNLTRDMCVNRFNNIVNYGGFPTIPEDNPSLPDFTKVNARSETNLTNQQGTVTGAGFPSNLYR